MRLISHFITTARPFPNPAALAMFTPPPSARFRLRSNWAKFRSSPAPAPLRSKHRSAGPPVNPQRRARVTFAFKELIEANMQELAELLASEHGKVMSAAKGVSAQHKARIEDYIQIAINEGSELVINGRSFSLQGYEDG